ncbi:MAG TPA: asparaginase [Segeticoccus sp.]|uniref:asparaginase n=1 Tax=Segeticoccus sp. TaxID=2706531 RepID=UPI002D7FC120|nr:asparaginase [Segeticoccus sp.]HET8601313.1 asparaginase [Segeticoccus sp.]
MSAAPADLSAAPVVARVTRSGFVESVHHGAVVVLDTDGTPVVELGDCHGQIFPRSCNKPFQTVAMLRHGLDLQGELLALSCASHSGESFHRDGARRILARAGLPESALQNTPDLPYGEEARRAWLAEGRGPEPLAQNCSGKHAAMLATCVASGWDTATYRDPAHPLQQAIAQTLTELTGEPVGAVGVDGCGAPVMATSLTGLARGFSRLATAAEGTEQERVCAAIQAHPEWLGGTGRHVTGLIRAVPNLIAKDGAEAVYAAALGDGRAVAVKIADGGERAARVLLVAALRRVGVDAPGLAELGTELVQGHGEPVGTVEPEGF